MITTNYFMATKLQFPQFYQILHTFFDAFSLKVAY